MRVLLPSGLIMLFFTSVFGLLSNAFSCNLQCSSIFIFSFHPFLLFLFLELLFIFMLKPYWERDKVSIAGDFKFSISENHLLNFSILASVFKTLNGGYSYQTTLVYLILLSIWCPVNWLLHFLLWSSLLWLSLEIH